MGESTNEAPLSMMIKSAMALRGAAKSAFYDGLFLQSIEPEVDESRVTCHCEWVENHRIEWERVAPGRVFRGMYSNFLFPTRMQFNLRNDG